MSRYQKSFGLVLATWLALASCTSSNTNGTDPKNTLKEYISKSFAIHSLDERAELSALLTGEVKARLAAWSEDQFRDAFIESKRQLIRFSIREVKHISPTEVDITYELMYLDPGKRRDGKTHETKVTNKKLCQLVLENGKWLISGVKNIKELVEYQNELSLP